MQLHTDTRMKAIEEAANSALHAVGFGLAIAALVVLVVHTSLYESAWHVVSVSIYGATLVLLYLASTLAHAFHATRAGRFLEICDRCAIYLLVAGTYTPFTLTVLRGGWGWSLFGIVWGLALLGIAFVVMSERRFSSITCLLYLLMGWTVVLAIVPILRLFPPAALVWLLLGGIIYSGGVLLFLSRKLFHHTLWHASVLCGSACHFCAVLTIIYS